MRKRIPCLMWLMALVAIVVPACSGLKGHVYDSQSNGGIFPTIRGAHLVFTSAQDSKVSNTHGDVHGAYQIDLPEGTYRVEVSAPGYRPYTSLAPVLVGGGGYTVSDIHMESR